MKHSPGYIIPLTLLLISFSFMLITSIVQTALNYQRLAKLNLDREQSRALAISGIQLALSQITFEQQEDKSEGKDNKPQDPSKKRAQQLIPIINTWQTIELTEPAVGVEGTIKLYITCEQGKINLNYLSDSIEKDKGKGGSETGPEGPYGSTQGLTKGQEEQKKTFSSSIDELIKKAADFSIVEALKKAQDRLGRKVEDATELKLDKKMFVEPAQEDKNKKPIYLMDLFTTTQGSGKLNPWFFSRSLSSALGLSEKDQAKNGKELAEKFKQTLQWPKDWDDIFVPVYGKKFDSIPKEISSLFSTQFEATAFSVVSYAKVGTVTQKVYALLESTDSVSPSSKNVTFKVTKLYWL